MTSISKNVDTDKLGEKVNKYNSVYHRTTKMKNVDVKSNTCINSSKEISDKDPKFKIGGNVRIAKHKNMFEKGYFPNWSEEVFVIKTLCCGRMLLVILMEKKSLVYKKELQKTNQKEF